MRSSGTPTARQCSIASLVGPEAELLVAAEDRDPDVVEVEPEAVLLRGREVERELDGLLLEVVAHREVAEHLEEGEMPERGADDLDVHRAERLLARRQPPARRLLLTAEVGLEGLHARRGEQNRRVVAARDERRRRHAKMAVPLEERQKPLPDLGSLHRALESRRRGARDAHELDPKAGQLAASRVAGPLFPAISVQFLAEALPLLQLSAPKVCIACACTRVARIYADDAQYMLLAEQLVGEARARRARSMDARERTVVAVFAALYCVAAVLIALFVPSERDVSLAPDRGSPARTRRGLSGALRVRHGLRRARAARRDSDAASAARCPTCRC